jgi:hypothetical protein
MSNLVCSSYEVLTVTTAVKTLTAAKITPTTGRFANQMADLVVLDLESYAIRYSLDTATTVSATVGAPMAAGDSKSLSEGSFRYFSAFLKSGEAGDAKLHIHYFHAV